MDQEFRGSLAGGSVSGSFMSLQSRCWTGLQSCQSLIGAERSSSVSLAWLLTEDFSSLLSDGRGFTSFPCGSLYRWMSSSHGNWLPPKTSEPEEKASRNPQCLLFFYFFLRFTFIIYLFIFGHLTGMQDLSSPTRDRTCAPCSGSTES